MFKRFTMLCLAVLLLAWPAPAAPKFPARTITIVVPFSAGGGGDLVTRNFASHFEKVIGKSVVVSNKDGGGGTIGASSVAHARPDGYTMVLAVVGPTVIQPLYGGTDYTKDDLRPVATIVNVPTLLAVNKQSGIKNLAEFVEKAKAEPGKLKITVAAAYGLPHLSVERFAKLAGIDVKVMPYKGANPAVAATLGGHAEGFLGHPSEILSHAQNGDLIPLVVFEPQRIADMPDVPTARELGYDVTLSVWRGLAVPKKTPDDVVKILEEAAAQTVVNPDYIKGLKNVGEPGVYLNAADSQKMWDEQAAMCENLLKDLGLYMQNKQ